MAYSIEQLVDIVQLDLSFSGLFPKILPDLEIKRLVREHALEFFYKEYQFAVQKIYFLLPKECMQSEVYTQYKYFIMPTEIEGITRMWMVDDPLLFRLGIQAPYLSINLGVTNQPFLTSFVSTIGDLAVYRSVISAFSDEINKMNRNMLKFNYNHVNKRLHILTEVTTPLVLECWCRIQEEELFDLQLFKDYVIGISRVRLGEAIGRINYKAPGNFQYNAVDIITQGKELVDAVKTKIAGESKGSWFIMSK